MHAAILILLLSASAAAAQVPRFTIDTPTQLHANSTLRALDEAGTLWIADTPLPRWLELRQEGRSLPPLLTRNFLLLTNGDRLPLDPDAAAVLDENRLRVWPAKSLPSAHARGLSLYVPNVVLVFWSLPEGVDDADLFFARLAEEPRKRDVVFLKNGDRVEGTLAELGAKAVYIMTTGNRKVHTSWSQLAGIAWNTDRQARLRPKKAYYRAVLEGGARVNFLDLRLEEKSRQWIAKTHFGATLELPESNVLAVEVRQGPAVDLSDLVPARYEHRPFLGASWPLMKDASAAGHPLRIGDNTYEKGLGTHAPCRVAYKLDGQYQRFDAVIGIDGEHAPRGRAKVAIELDGKRIDLNDGKEMTSKTAPIPLRLDVRGVREMTLIVELGSFGDVQAHVNWAKTRLVK